MSEVASKDDEIEIVDLVVLPHGAGALCKFHVQIGPVRLYSCELFRVTNDNGESRGLSVRWPKKTSVRAGVKKAVKAAAAAAFREAAG
jgi:hypothetical protein